MNWQARAAGPPTGPVRARQRATAATLRKQGFGHSAIPARSRQSARMRGVVEAAPFRLGQASVHRSCTTKNHQAHREIPCAQASRLALQMESSRSGKCMCKCTSAAVSVGGPVEGAARRRRPLYASGTQPDGHRSSKVVPVSASDRAANVPPCALAISSQMCRPNPMLLPDLRGTACQ